MDGLVRHNVGVAYVHLAMGVHEAPETRCPDDPRARPVLPSSVGLTADLQEDGRVVIVKAVVEGHWTLKDGSPSVYLKSISFERPTQPRADGTYAAPEWLRTLITHYQQRLDLLVGHQIVTAIRQEH